MTPNSVVFLSVVLPAFDHNFAEYIDIIILVCYNYTC